MENNAPDFAPRLRVSEDFEVENADTKLMMTIREGSTIYPVTREQKQTLFKVLGDESKVFRLQDNVLHTCCEMIEPGDD